MAVHDFVDVDYKWSAPFVWDRVADEPDHASFRSLIVYDYSKGRLGSDTTIHVDGSDDSTHHSVLSRTEVVVEVPTPDGVAGVVVEPRFELQEVVARIVRSDEEYGVSTIEFEWRSAPVARLLDQERGGPLIGDALYSSSAFGNEGWITGPAIGVDEDYLNPPKAGTTEVRRFTFDDVASRPSLEIAVGIENRLTVNSNDWTYDARLRSHWLLTSVKVTVVET